MSQRRYRQRQKAAFNGIEEVRARMRIAHIKATGQYEAFKAKKAKEGMRRYHATSEEQRNEVKRKNLLSQKAWRERMIREGTYEEYRRRLNARRRQQMAEKKRAMGLEEWKALQRAKMSNVPSQSDAKGVTGWTSIWPVPFLYRGCHWTGQSPSLGRERTRCKPFVRTR